MKVNLLAAVTADGFIGRSDSDLSTQWTSREDTKFFVKFSKEVRHLILGSKTFATFDRELKERTFYVYSRSSEVPNPFNNEMEVVSQDPQSLLARLEANGIDEVMVAGGSNIYTLFLNAGVVTDIYLVFEPVLFGKGISLFSDAVSVRLELVEVIDLSEQTKVFHYQVLK